MHSFMKLSSPPPISVVRAHFAKILTANNRYSTEVENKIEIPKRISRGSTDILQALESTITRDPTAAHYKYHDDPYLIPMSNLGKRTFAMAQEAGRKAAHWIRKEHADLFQHREADPIIKAFIPKVNYNEDSQVVEEDLKNVIKEALVSDAILIYKLLKDKGIAISSKTQQSLLELLCFYNHNNTLPEEFIEERWFRQTSKAKERQRKTWKDGDLAEEIFIGINEPNSDSYSAIIQGMIKFGQIERGWQLFEEAETKGLLLSTDTYSSIIGATSFLKEGYDLRWIFMCDMLTVMVKANIKPNLLTLNEILKTLSTMGSGKIVKHNALKTLAEFRALGIEPCLTSWYYILIIFCKERGPINPILHDIINHLEGKHLQIQDLRDNSFFLTAMDICNYHLHDKDLAKRVHKLLNFGNNYDLIGDSYKESIYYRHYVTLLCQTQSIEEFMENTYITLIPHLYVPEPSVMYEILKSVEAHDAVGYLPKLWSDMIIFDQIDRENLINITLDMMMNTRVDDIKTNEQFSQIAWSIFEKIENQSENRIKKLSFTGEMLGKIMILLLKNEEFEKASGIMEKLNKKQHEILGVPSLQALNLFVEHCIKHKLPSPAIKCIEYAADNGFEEASELAITLNKNLTLDETHLDKFTKIFGQDLLNINLKT